MNRHLMGRAAPLALITVLLAAAPAAAAEQGAILRGRVSDAQGRPLAGAAVTIAPGDLTLVTDAEGFFASHPLAAGGYTVEILYLGSETFTQKVPIEDGKPAVLTVKLRASAHGTQVVTVTATRLRGEVEALNQEKNAQDIVNVLPADVITSLPNANVADAIGRLPSVSLERDEGEGKYIQVRGLESRYTSVSVNGVRIPSAEAGVRQIKLDAFPSDLLGTIELHKTASADQEGDAIGGSVNLVTKTAPDTPYYSVAAEGGHNSQAGGRNSYQFSGTFAGRFGADNALGVVLGASYDYNGRSIWDIEPTPGIVTPVSTGKPMFAFTDIDMRDYVYQRKRFGMAGGLDYRLSDTSSIYFKALFSQFQNYGDRWVTAITAESFNTPTLTDNSGGYSAGVQNRRPVEQTWSLLAGGKHDLGGGLQWDYNVAVSHAQQHRDNQLQGKFDGPAAAFIVDSSDPYHPRFYPQDGVNINDPTQYTLTKWQITNEDTDTRSLSLGTNLVIPYAGGEIKTGLKYRDEDKSNFFADTSLKYDGETPYTMAMGLDPFTDPNYYSGHYVHGPNASLWAINAFYQANKNLFSANASDDRQSNDPNNWDAKEKVTALYVKNTSNLSSSRLEFGVRLERTATSFTANQVNVDSDGNWLSTTPMAQSRNYTNVLPSAAWRYAFDKDTLLRVVFSMALARPDYGLMVPSLTLNESPANSISTGNPDLKPTKATNYDILFEHYLNPVGILSAGVFYKDLTDPIYPQSNSTIVGGIHDGWTLSQPINGPKANLYGFEVAWKQHLTFLPGAFSGLGTDINFTYTHSEATFDPATGRSGTAPLQRTAPREANFGLTYDWKAFSMRLAATYNSAMIFGYNFKDGNDGGVAGPNGDTYLYPHTQVDAQATYTFKNGLKVVLSALNLTDAVFGFYNGSPQFNIQREFYSRTYTLGLHYNW